MLRIGVLSSRRAPGLAYLLDNDPNRGTVYEVEGGLSTDPAGAASALLRSAGVPSIVHDIRRFYEERGARRADLRVRRAFDARTRELVASWRLDVLVLTGYLHIVTAPLLDAYPQSVISVHDGDLPAYPGLHATRDAVRAGAPATYCTVHLVTADVDAGPVLLRSAPYPVEGRHHYLQREWMMREAWGPLISQALTVLARPAATGPAVPATIEAA